MTRIDKLLSISSASIAPPPSERPELLLAYPLCAELFSLLKKKNGFYAFESALHVFPCSPACEPTVTLEDWNSDSLWRKDYADLADGLLFFAEDVFQDQFSLSQNGILRFKSETGEREFIADSLEEWAGMMLLDYEFQTGWTLATKWQAENGSLTNGHRLMSKIPSFSGGEYSVANLWAGDVVEGMRFKADLATQTRHLPDGSTVKLTIGKKPEK